MIYLSWVWRYCDSLVIKLTSILSKTSSLSITARLFSRQSDIDELTIWTYFLIIVDLPERDLPTIAIIRFYSKSESISLEKIKKKESTFDCCHRVREYRCFYLLLVVWYGTEIAFLFSAFFELPSPSFDSINDLKMVSMSSTSILSYLPTCRMISFKIARVSLWVFKKWWIFVMYLRYSDIIYLSMRSYNWMFCFSNTSFSRRFTDGS